MEVFISFLIIHTFLLFLGIWLSLCESQALGNTEESCVSVVGGRGLCVLCLGWLA